MPAGRALLCCLIAMALAGAAQAGERTVNPPLKKVFPYLDGYLSLPAQERNLFRPVYRLVMDGKPSPLIRLTLEGRPIALGADGRVPRLPDLEALKSGQKAELSCPEGHKINLVIEVEPTIAPAAEMDARALAAAVRQATTGAKKAAGLLGFAAPRLDRVVFEGAAGGQAIDVQGRATALAAVKGAPVFDPARQADARLVRFTRAPRRMVLDKAS